MPIQKIGFTGDQNAIQRKRQTILQLTKLNNTNKYSKTRVYSLLCEWSLPKSYIVSCGPKGPVKEPNFYWNMGLSRCTLIHARHQLFVTKLEELLCHSIEINITFVVIKKKLLEICLVLFKYYTHTHTHTQNNTTKT